MSMDDLCLKTIPFQTCTIYDLYNDIQFKLSKLFIDTRTEQEYNLQHIRSAINIPFESLPCDTSKMASKIDALLSNKVYTIKKLMFYSSDDESGVKQHAFYHHCAQILTAALKQKCQSKINLTKFYGSDLHTSTGPSLYVSDGSYAEFEAKFPFLCDDTKTVDASTDGDTVKSMLLMDFLSIYMNRNVRIKDEFKVYPSCILDDQYFLGNANQSSDENTLRRLGITHILNCTATLHNKFELKSSTNLDEKQATDNVYTAEYLRVPVNDIPDQCIQKYFISAIRFIDAALGIDDYKARILCHCHAGISRSTTITIAYLMFARDMSMCEALGFIEQRREIVNPNHGFKQQLFEFEKYLNGKRVLLKRRQLYVADLTGFDGGIDANGMNDESDDGAEDGADVEEDFDFLSIGLRMAVGEYFKNGQLIYDEVFEFLDRYGSMIRNQFPTLFGVLLQDVMLNETNVNRQSFILLLVELFKVQQIDNRDNHFVEYTLLHVAKNFYDNLIDCPYLPQFMASLIAQLIHTAQVVPECLVIFCEAVIKSRMEEIMKVALNKVHYQCSKMVLYCLKELELLQSEYITSFGQMDQIKTILCAQAFEHAADQQYLTYLDLQSETKTH